MLKLLHTADLHLGASFPGFAEKAKDHKERVYKSWQRIVALALEEKVDLVVIAGDVFDNFTPTEQTISRFTNELERLVRAGIHVAILPGNHDRLEKGSIWHDFVWVKEPGQEERRQKYVHLLIPPAAESTEDFEQPHHLAIADLGVNIFGRAVAKQKSNQEQTEGFAEFVSQAQKAQTAQQNAPLKYNLAVLHGSLAIPGRQANYPISAEGLQAVLNAGVDYIALGDWHGYLDLADSSKLPKGKAIYPGAPEYQDKSQPNSGQVVIVSIVDASGTDDSDSSGNPEIQLQRRKISELNLEKKSYDLAQTKWQTALKDLRNSAAEQSIMTAEFNGELPLPEMLDAEMHLNEDKLFDEFSTQFYQFNLKLNLQLQLDASNLSDYPKGSIPHEYIKLVDEKIKSGLDKGIAQKVLTTGMAAILDKGKKS